MLKILMFLFIVPALALGEVTLGQGKTLDDILVKTKQIRTEGIKGFVLQNKAPVSPVITKAISTNKSEFISVPRPDTGKIKAKVSPVILPDSDAWRAGTTKSISASSEFISVPHPDTGRIKKPVPVYGRFVPYQSYLDDISDLNNKINALQVDYAATSAKMTVILDNMVTNSGTQKDSLDLLTKFMEAFSALIAALGSAIALWHIFKRRNA